MFILGTLRIITGPTAFQRERGIDTVILPEGIKQKLTSDLDNFLEAATSTWYAKHGIPYKRSYLFYGAPGTGKTSTIAAMAGYTKRNIAYLHVSDPKMTDSMLKKALQRVPGKCVVVLEDVDALFSLNRKNLGDIPLSFSGLLNALDGIGGKDATIFVLTSNHIERLDPALIRPGRIDVHMEFPRCTDEQIGLMFKQFYPDAPESLSEDFGGRVSKLRESIKNLSTATLQQYFIAHRTSSAFEAVRDVDAEMSSPFSKANLASLAAFTKEAKNLQEPE
jgi:chaperone BCS1